MSSFPSHRSNLNDSEKCPAESGKWRSRNPIQTFQGQPLKANASWGQGNPTIEQGWRERDYQGWSARSGNESQSTSFSLVQTTSLSTTSYALPEHRHKKPRREQDEVKSSISPPFEPTWTAPQSLLNLPEYRHKKPRREQDEVKPLTSPPFEPTWPAPQSLLNLLVTPPTLEKTPTVKIKVEDTPLPLFCAMPKENLGQPLNDSKVKAQPYETATILREVYGFVLTPSSSTSSKLGEIAADDFSSKKRMQVSVGIDRDESEFFASPLAQPALDFLNLFKESESAPAMSDLSQRNPMCLEKSPMFRYLVRPIKGLYIFDFGERATRPWLLAVEKAAVALYIARMDPALTDYEIARSLVHRGIAFYTIRALPCILSTPIPHTESTTIRPLGYKFTVDDYRAYSRRREALLLGTPRGRAALLKGGIIWRLAVETLNLVKSLDGPSSEVVVHRRGRIYPTDHPSLDFCDDDLSIDELDDICGINYVLTGKPQFFAPLFNSPPFFLSRERQPILP